MKIVIILTSSARDDRLWKRKRKRVFNRTDGPSQ